MALVGNEVLYVNGVALDGSLSGVLEPTTTQAIANLADAGAALTPVSVTSAQSVATTNPATTRNVYGKLSLTYAGAVTEGSGSGSAVGVRGEVAVGNAATVLGAGYYYGAQGKITSVASGTIGAGARAFGTIGQFDLSLGTVSGNPQISAVWGDMGATAPSGGWGTASSIVSGQNTTASAVNSLLYLYGKGTYVAEIDDNGAGIVNTSVPCTTISGSLKVICNGVVKYIPLYTAAS